MLGKIEGRRRRGRQRMIWKDDITDSMGMNLGDGVGQRVLAWCNSWGYKDLDMTGQLSNSKLYKNHANSK